MKQAKEKPVEERTLAELCDVVMSYIYPFEDLAELIENKAFTECENKQIDKATHQLRRLADFFEHMENKNEENCRDLTDVYVLTGEMNQCYGRFRESIGWFKKAIVVNDRHSAAYHSLAISYTRLNDVKNAVRSLEQEVRLSPGNYFSYLLLADLHEGRGDLEKTEEVLNALLERDPDNLQALHKVISHYEHVDPGVDVELLRRRVVSVRKQFNKVEMVIWTYHMCVEKQFTAALRYLTARENESPDVTIIHLLKAYAYGQLRQFTKKRAELVKFRNKNSGRETFMRNKLKEFEDVFGKKAVTRLSKKLLIS